MKVPVTGATGFTEMHTQLCLPRKSKLKHYRLRQLEPFINFKFRKVDLANRDAIFVDWYKEYQANHDNHHS